MKDLTLYAPWPDVPGIVEAAGYTIIEHKPFQYLPGLQAHNLVAARAENRTIVHARSFVTGNASDGEVASYLRLYGAVETASYTREQLAYLSRFFTEMRCNYGTGGQARWYFDFEPSQQRGDFFARLPLIFAQARPTEWPFRTYLDFLERTPTEETGNAAASKARMDARAIRSAVQIESFPEWVKAFIGE